MITHENWFNTNIRDKLTNINFELKLQWNLKPFKKMRFHEAADYTAKLIAKQTNKPIYIGLSGGYDSEYTLSTFMRNNIKVIPLIVTCDGNQTETAYAFHFCRINNLEPKVLHMSDKDLLRVYLRDIVGKMRAKATNMVATVYACDHVTSMNGIFISSDHLFTDGFETVQSNDAFCVAEHDDYLYALFPETEALQFFMYTPELCQSMIESLTTEDLTWPEAKWELYGLTFRPKIKYKYSDKILYAMNGVQGKNLSHSVITLGNREKTLKIFDSYANQ